MTNYTSTPKTIPADEKKRLLELWRRSLTGDDISDPKKVVVAELAEYFNLPVDEVQRRCVKWEDDSLKEWEAKDRSTHEGLLDFYRTQVSWIFDTMWYHANQYHGQDIAQSVEIAEGLPQLVRGQHLDFGAGPGSSSLFFHELGWQVSLADISTTMQDFARWRLEKHGVKADYYDTSREVLPTAKFDLITAFDVVAHIKNIEATLVQLRNSLKPYGYLVFNIDARPKAPKNQWHLYEAHYPILRQVRSSGFTTQPRIGHFYVFQKVERSPLQTTFVGLADHLRYNKGTSWAGKAMRRISN